MRVSLNWLKEYVDIEPDVDTLARQMTMLGLEIESIERPGAEIQDVYVGKILSIDPHPDADKLVVCRTDVGADEALQIVCGAKNMRVGDMVPTAVVGATLPGGFTIDRRKMRGVESQGMMCSTQELGLGEDHSGLLILDGDLPIGADAKPLLGLDDVIFEIEVIPNRGDWASMIGVARELAALYDNELRIPAITLRESAPPASEFSSVTIEAPDLCPRYIGRVLTNVTIGPSPRWLCRRLIAAGQRLINNVVDVTNFVLMETGHPLHAFDYDKLAQNRIVARRARDGEIMKTLDGESHTLGAEMLVIADGERPQAVAGIMGGEHSEVGEGTTRVFLESAYFNPVSIRRTSRALGISSESSLRFQRGADPEMAEYAINRAAMLMQQLAGAQIAEGLLDEYPKALEERRVRLRYARCNLLLGAEIDAHTQRNALEKLDFEVLESGAESCTVRAPSWRHDVSVEADLIEEVARLYGYDNIGVTLPRVRQSTKIFAPNERAVRQLRSQLAGQGLTELFNWTFSSLEAVRRAGLKGAYLDMVTLANPLSENQATMRSTLIPGLLVNAARNINHGVLDIAAFELGPVYKPLPDQDLPHESLRLGILLSGVGPPKHWSRPQASTDFYDLKGQVEAMLDFMGVSPAAFRDHALGTFQPGQSAAVVLQKDIVGYLGKVSKNVLKAYDIEQNVYLAELDLERLLALRAPASQFKQIPSFPPSSRDLAVLVDRDVPAGALKKLAEHFGAKLLKSVEIFDVYTGEQLPEGKKSVALNLTFQSDERTLTDDDTQKAWEKIVRRMQNDYGAELR